MDHRLHAKLLSKGWHPDEVAYAVSVLEGAHQKKTSWIKLFDVTVYWVALLLGLLGNFVLAVVLIPILILAKGVWLFLLVFLFAFSFGALFTFLLEHIEILSPKYHLLNWLILPVFSFITVSIITSLTNQFDMLIGRPLQIHNYWIISLVYTISFMLPYILLIHREYILNKRA